MSNISNFKTNFNGGVRPNQFKVSLDSGPAGGANLEFLCKASSIPASVVGNIDVPYLGRQLKVPGDRTFEDWTLTVFNTESWDARSYFERWMNSIQEHANPTRSRNITPVGVYGQGKVEQLSRTGGTIATYFMEDIYPTNVAAIDLAFDTNDAVEEFQVTFAINNWYNQLDPERRGNGNNASVQIGVRGNIGGVGFSINSRNIGINI